MEAPLHVLRRHVEELHAAWAGALPALSAPSGDAQTELEQMSDDGLVRVGELLARVRRDTDAVLAGVAAEVSRRSGPEFGESCLSKAHGFHNAPRLLAASTGGTRHEAARLIAVGRATAYRQSFGGERLPARPPHVAAALRAGDIGLDAASAITSMLDRVAVRTEPDRSDTVESTLVELASQVPLDLLMRGVREAEARLDEDGVEPREQDLWHERSLTIREDVHGMLHLHARLDPENGAPVKAAIEALVSDVLRRREPTSSDGCAIVDDLRTIPQIQADALAAIARHSLGCAQTITPLAKTTVVVRLDLETLRSGIGHARIDGIDQPISAATARRMAADGGLIPAVLGGQNIALSRPTTSPGGSATPVRPTWRTACSSAASAITWCIGTGGESARRPVRCGSSRHRMWIRTRHRDSGDVRDSNRGRWR